MSIGQSPYRIDAPGKVTGATLYPADLAPNSKHQGHLLHGKVLFSGQPHARLRAIDTRAAEAVPGVVAIFTAKDVPVNEYGLIMADQPVLVGLDSASGLDSATDLDRNEHSAISRWEGDQVALVVAETEEIAARARDLIHVEWETRPVINDVLTAIEDTHLLHPKQGSNTFVHYKIRKGDMAQGWDDAEVVIDGDYHLPHQEHAYLQPEAGLSYVDEAERITIEIAGQWTHEDQMQIAHALNLPTDRIRVIYPAIGGAFGGREDMSLQIVLALGTMHLYKRGIKRPLRIIWSREESIIGHHKRHQVKIKTRWGAKKTGEITAVEATVYLDAGAYNYTSNKVLGNIHLSVAGPYVIPNAYIDSYAVYTNNVPGGAFRGFGAPQAAFVAENQMNKLAAALGIDPVEIRERNLLRDGVETITQMPLPTGVSLPQVLQSCVTAANWHQPAQEPTPAFKSLQSLPPTPAAIRRGRGLACAFKNVGFSFGFPERCEATIELHGDVAVDHVILRQAGAEVGQGAHTAFKQMAAQAVGVPLEHVELIASDTATTGDSGSASASRLTWMAGNAIRGAAEKALMAWQNEDRPAIGHVRYTPPPTEPFDPETGLCTPNFTYGYVAEVVELAIDIETGHIAIERVVCANDVGKAINPALIEGQIEGAIVQAQGYAITENLQVQSGHILNPRLSMYLIPGILDIPIQVESVILEVPDPLGPWGVRGMAEMPFIPLAPAITAALYNATGVWFDELPLTPAKVLANLK